MKHTILEALQFRRRPDTNSSLYTPIDASKGEIRLIHLLPGDVDHEINIELVQVSLSSDPQPRYDALSYVWGREQCQTPALVNGKPFTITSNLDVALRHFRDGAVKKILWVDAVCINQGDTVEKGPQVQMMGRIYSGAARVLIWLGQAADGSDELLDHISGSVGGEAEEGEGKGEWAVDRTLWDSSLALMGRPWFTRTWVQQEIALARLDPIMCCGRRTVTFLPWCECILKMLFGLEDAFREVMWRQQVEGVATRPAPNDSEAVVESKHRKLLQHIENNKRWIAIQQSLITAENLAYLRVGVEMASGTWNDKMFELTAYIRSKTPRSPTRMAEGSMPSLAKVGSKPENYDMDEDTARDLIKSLVSREKPTEFPRLLRAACRLDATDPRDKVFGILGLAKFNGKPILADYKKTKRQVYSEAYAAVIRDSLDMSYTMWSVFGSKNKGLPSWVPDLGHDATAGGEIGPDDRALQNALYSSFNGVPLATFSDNHQTLHVGGVELGSVQVAFQQPITEDPELANPDERFKMRDEVKALVEEKIPIRTMWQTLMGAGNLGYTWGGEQLEVFESEDKMLQAVSIICGQGDIGLQEGHDRLTKDDLRVVQCQISEVCDKNTLFLTDTGRVGQVRGKVQKGDIVAALFGVGIPFVLRRATSLSTMMKELGKKERTQETYEMIGTCHIGEHEYGHPEVPRDVKEGDLYQVYGFRTFVIN